MSPVRPTTADRITPATRVFIGLFPTGIVYADRFKEEHGDYKRLAYLNYETLRLEVAPNVPPELQNYIMADAGSYKRGQRLQYSSSGQSIILGSACPNCNKRRYTDDNKTFRCINCNKSETLEGAEAF